jgi:hypothetical protein
MNWTKPIQNVLVVVVSLGLSLLLAEVVVRMTALSTGTVVETGNQYKFYEFDARLGWKNSPGRHGRYTREEFSYDLNINSLGMRYREVSMQKPARKTRIAVLGDSFVWGIGVSDQDRFTEQVEEMTGGKYELLNFGVSGYGPIQHYLMFDEIVKGFSPDVVLITFCLGNDFADNVFWKRYGYYKPYVRETGGPDVVIAGYPLPRAGEFFDGAPMGWLTNHSRLYTLGLAGLKRVLASVQYFGQAGLVGADESERDIYFPSQSASAGHFADSMAAINEKLLAQIREKAVKSSVKLAVVVAPTKCEYGACFAGEEARNMRARDRLLQTLRELDIQVIDKTEVMGISDFWKTDGHWRPSGHAKIADGIIDWLNAGGRSMAPR